MRMLRYPIFFADMCGFEGFLMLYTLWKSTHFLALVGCFFYKKRNTVRGSDSLKCSGVVGMLKAGAGLLILGLFTWSRKLESV